MGSRKLTFSTYDEIIREEPRNKSFWRDVTVEVVSTFLLVAVHCSVALTWGKPVRNGELVQPGLGMACIVVAMLEALGPLGGTHMNPAVTISMFLSLKVTFVRGRSMQCLVNYTP